MVKKTYFISGMVQLWNLNDVIFLENYKIDAYSEKQAKFLLAKELHEKLNYNQKMIYQRIVRSRLLIKTKFGGINHG